MNDDPMDRLRADASRGPAGSDSFDADGVLSQVRSRTQGEAPGGLTRRRAQARTFAVAGVGALAAAGLAVTAAVVPGSLGSKDSVAVADAPLARPSAVAVARAPAPTPTPTVATAQGAAVTQSVALVKRSSRAIDAVDLDSLVLKTKSTEIWHDYKKKPSKPTIEVDIQTGDGTVDGAEFIADDFGRATSAGDAEWHVAIPGSTDGSMLYYEIERRQGFYTTFPWNGFGETAGALIAQGSSRFGEIVETMKSVEDLASQPGVKAAPVTSTKIGGLAAKCVKLSADGKAAATIDTGRVGWGDVDWSWRVCFDAKSGLPLLDEWGQHYRAEPDSKAHPDYEVTTKEYTWMQRGDAATEALLKPNVDGLRWVSRDEWAASDDQ